MSQNVQDLTIEVDEGTLRRTSSGKVTGTLYARLSGYAFPEQSWSDFVLVVLTWWTESMADLLIGSPRDAEWYFMDGPFRIEVEAAPAAPWRVYFVDSSEGNRVEMRGEVDPAQVAQSLRVAAEKTLAAVRSNGWQLPEIEQLERSLRVLSARV
jgi:hypothetical protein